LSEVAAKADVPLGTLYRYFPSAAQLAPALYRKQLTELPAASR
jgi:AcrR family transcriptional regulator